MIIKDLLLKSSKELDDKGVSNAKKEALELLAFHLSCSPSDIYFRFNEEVLGEQLSAYLRDLSKRAARIPLAYIIGEFWFYGVKLKIDNRVLVPRCETELMVDEIAKKLEGKDLNSKVLFDICTGSACIGLSLKNKFKELLVHCSDISEDALDLAKENAKNNHLYVLFHQGSYFEPFATQKAHFIISNPPYISEEEYAFLEPEVKNEPKIALVEKDSGLKAYKILAEGLSKHLERGGMAWLEMGHMQAKALKEIFKTDPWKTVEIFKDLSGHDRVFFLEKE